eukprot:scaffold12867_cov176-Ochromonas_danica.AAC.2
MQHSHNLHYLKEKANEKEKMGKGEVEMVKSEREKKEVEEEIEAVACGRMGSTVMRAGQPLLLLEEGYGGGGCCWMMSGRSQCEGVWKEGDEEKLKRSIDEVTCTRELCSIVMKYQWFMLSLMSSITLHEDCIDPSIYWICSGGNNGKVRY